MVKGTHHNDSNFPWLRVSWEISQANMRSPSLNERRLTWWSKVALDHFLAASLCCNEDQRSSKSDSKVSRCCSIGAMPGKISMVVHNVGILHSIGRVASIPWTRWNGVKLVVVLTTMR
jgi:hypothetical protein